MIDWSRLEFFPRWGEARARRRVERESRIELASQDAIFFSASAANATEWWLLVVFFMLGAVGNFCGWCLLSHEYPEYGRFFKVLGTALGIVAVLPAARCLSMAFRSGQEWREAANRRAARVSRPQPMV